MILCYFLRINKDFIHSFIHCFYKNETFGIPSYPSNLISLGVHSYNTQNSVTYHCRTDTLFILPLGHLGWNKLDLTLCKSSYKIFRNTLLKMICPPPNPVYDTDNPLGIICLQAQNWD